MIEISNAKVYDLEEAIIASGFPMDAGELYKSFDQKAKDLSIEIQEITDTKVNPVNKDLKRAIKLANTPSNSGHPNFMTGILVSFNIKYPQYFSMQFQRYHFVQIVSSASKMHKLIDIGIGDKYPPEIANLFDALVEEYNRAPTEEMKKIAYTDILNMLPMGFELWMRVTTNYLQLKTIYHQRKNHRLDEWKQFCSWIETLPLANYFITCS